MDKNDDKDKAGLFRYNINTGKLTAFPAVQFNRGEGDKQPMLEGQREYLVAGIGWHIHKNKWQQVRRIRLRSTQPYKANASKALCTALYEMERGAFWLGTEEGFAKIDFAKVKNNQPAVTWYFNNAADRNSLNYNHVSCFLDDPADPNKYLWIGTKGGGLNRLDKTTGDFFHLTTKDGLPNDVVYGILADNKAIYGAAPIKECFV